MPRDLFAEMNTNQESVKAPVDLFQQAGVAPDNRGQFQKAKDGVKEFGKDLGQYYKGVGQGLVNTGINAANYLPELARQLAPGANLMSPQIQQQMNQQSPKIDNVQYADPNSMAGKAGNFAGNVAGAALPFVGPMARAPLAMQMAAGGLYGASQNPDNRAMGVLEGAAPLWAAEKLISPAINAVSRDGFSALNPSNMTANVLSKFGNKNIVSGEEMNALAKQAGNLPVSLGDVIGSPTLSNFYNRVVSNSPFSGALTKQAEVNAAVKNEANQVKDALKPSNVGETEVVNNVVNAIKQNKDNAGKEVKALYGEVNDIAKNANITVVPQEVKNTAQSYLDKHYAAVKAGGKSPLTSAEVKELENIAGDNIKYSSKTVGYKEMPGAITQADNIYPNAPEVNAKDPVGKNASARIVQGKVNYKEPMSFNTAQHSASAYGKAGHKAGLNNDSYIAGMYRDLDSAMQKDMVLAAEQSGNGQLIEKLKNADEAFKNNVVPYKQKEIQQLVNETKDLKKLDSLLLKTTNEKVFQDLPPEIKSQVAYLRMGNSVKQNPATGKYEVTDPKKFFEKFNDLPPYEKEAIFSKSQQDMFNRLGSLNKLNNFDVVKNGGDLTGAANVIANLKGYLLTGTGRIANNALTSPNIRQKVVNNLLRPQTPQPVSNAISDPIRAMMLGGFAGYQPNQNNGVQ